MEVWALQLFNGLSLSSILVDLAVEPHLAVEKAGSTEVAAVKTAAKGLTFDAPGGKVTIHDTNQHVAKTVRIGEVRLDGQIDEIWNSGSPVIPDPYLDTYPWAEGLRDQAQ